MEGTRLPAVGQLESTPEILRGLMSELTEEEARWKPAPDRFFVAEVLRTSPTPKATVTVSGSIVL